MKVSPSEPKYFSSLFNLSIFELKEKLTLVQLVKFNLTALICQLKLCLWVGRMCMLGELRSPLSHGSSATGFHQNQKQTSLPTVSDVTMDRSGSSRACFDLIARIAWSDRDYPYDKDAYMETRLWTGTVCDTIRTIR